MPIVDRASTTRRVLFVIGLLTIMACTTAAHATSTTFRWSNLGPNTYWADCQGGDASVSWWLGYEVMVWCNNAAVTGNPYIVWPSTVKYFRADSVAFRGRLYTCFTRVEDLGRTIKVVLSNC